MSSSEFAYDSLLGEASKSMGQILPQVVAAMDTLVALTVAYGFLVALAVFCVWIIWSLAALAFRILRWALNAARVLFLRRLRPLKAEEEEAFFEEVAFLLGQEEDRPFVASSPCGRHLDCLSLEAGGKVAEAQAITFSPESSGYLSGCSSGSSPNSPLARGVKAVGGGLRDHEAEVRPFWIQRRHWKRLIEEGNDIRARTEETSVRDRENFLLHRSRVMLAHCR